MAAASCASAVNFLAKQQAVAEAARASHGSEAAGNKPTDEGGGAADAALAFVERARPPKRVSTDALSRRATTKERKRRLQYAD